MFRPSCSFVSVALLLAAVSPSCQGFSTNNNVMMTSRHPIIKRTTFYTVLWNSESSSSSSEEEAEELATPTTEKKLSLEEKMKSWEASEEEIKAATLGGIVPQQSNKERSDAFDVGLYIAFPIMVITGLIFALFPFIMGSIDVDSVGPPPTV
jgi:type III secretory pathway component EscR